MKQLTRIFISFLFLSLSLNAAPKKNDKSEPVSGKKPMTWEDVMKFKSMRFPSISEDGQWVAWAEFPDRGDGSACFRNTTDTTKLYRIERGSAPVISSNSSWGAVTQLPKALDVENAKSPKDRPKNGLTLVNLTNGETKDIPEVSRFEFSRDANWLAYAKFEDPNRKKPGENDKFKNKELGNDLYLRHLASGTDIIIRDAKSFLFDSTNKYFFYVISQNGGKGDGIYMRKLAEPFAPEVKLTGGENKFYDELKFHSQTGNLAFITADLQNDGSPKEASLAIWNAALPDSIKIVVDSKKLPKDWYVHYVNHLTWTADGSRIFFGIKPVSQKYDLDKYKIKYSDSSYYDVDSIMQKTEVSIWHTNDARIMPNQKVRWKTEKDKVYASYYSLADDKFVQLGNTNMTEVEFNDNPNYALGYDESPYERASTWTYSIYDIYKLDLKTGSKKLITQNLEESAYLSPTGRFIAYFKDKNWYIYDNEKDSTIWANERIIAPFYDINQDIPSAPQSLGVGGWIGEKDDAVLLYQNYDIWKVFTDPKYGAHNMTGAIGNADKIQFRIFNLDPDKKFWGKKDTALVVGFNTRTKYQSLHFITINMLGTERLILDSNKRFTPIARAKRADKLLFTRQSYEEFPDLWVASPTYKPYWDSNYKKISTVNPDMGKYLWGKTELVSWTNQYGDTLQGFIIKPENFDPKRRYPVVIHYYERFSDELNTFSVPRINHRPNFQVYTGDGYVIFMPDIKYHTGNPGFDATDALVRGARKLAEMGVADSNAIGLQGHSWSGYQTAFIITQTDFFKAASAGAPVGNMTSAYSGIRGESGLARQFQYERQQSRIGGNLWDSLSNYINNSPIFQAQKVHTPFLMMFGNVDEMVPWQQGIELYLALRRLDKNVVFLEYNDEPHIMRKYQNKVDYATKMKEFFDHYLKGAPAKDWMLTGKPYKGE